VLTLSRFLLPIALRRVAHCPTVQVQNGEQLLDLYRQFQAGQVRFLLAFRHPSPHQTGFWCLEDLRKADRTYEQMTDPEVLKVWCLEDLRKADRTETVLIVPIGIQYTYLDPPWQAVTQLLIQLERDSGLVGQGNSEVELYQRLTRLGEHLLTLMEQFYANFYPHVSLPPRPMPPPRSPIASRHSSKPP